MSDEGKPLQPEHTFKRIIWRSTLSQGQAVEQSTMWTTTGVAAIVGLFISNLDATSKIVSISGMRWSLSLFAFSLLAGAVSKQLAMAVQAGVRTSIEVETVLNSEPGQALIKAMTTDIRTVLGEIAGAFIWPLSYLVKQSAERGIRDYLSADKRMVRMFCLQV